MTTVCRPAPFPSSHWVDREACRAFRCIPLRKIIADECGLVARLGLLGTMAIGCASSTNPMVCSTHGIRALAPSSSGGIWVGSDCGFDLIDENCRVVDRTDFSAPLGLVECFTVGPQGQLVAGTNYGAYVLADSTWNPLDPGFDEFISALCFDSIGTLWAATSSGLRKWDDTAWVCPAAEDWKAGGRLRTLQSYGCGELLVGGDDGLLIVSDNGEAGNAARLSTASGVTCVLLDHDELWLAAGREVRHCAFGSDDPTFALVAPVVANDLFRDLQGNVWIATDSTGVLKVSLMRKAITRPAVSPVGAVLSIVAASVCGDIVVGTESGAQVVRPDGSLRVPLDEFSGERVWDTLYLGDGTLLAACHSGLLSVTMPVSTVTKIGADHDVLGAPTRSLLIDGTAVLVGSIRGLCRYLDGTIEEIKRPDGGSLGYVYSLTRISDTEVWVSTLGDGLWRLVDGRTLTPIRSKELIDTGNTYCVSVGEHNTVVLQDNRIVVLNMTTGRARRVIETQEAVAGWACVHGIDASLWVGSSSGLRNYDLSTGELTRQVTSWLGVDAWEFTTSRSLRIDDRSMLWCGVTGGVLMVDPSHLPARDDLPVPQLADVTWTLATGEAPQLRNNSFELTEGKWSFDAHMFAAWYIDESDARFSGSSAGLRSRMVGVATGNGSLQFDSGGALHAAEPGSLSAGWVGSAHRPVHARRAPLEHDPTCG